MITFGTISIVLETIKPQDTDADIEERYVEFETVRDKIEGILDQLLPDGWKGKVI